MLTIVMIYIRVSVLVGRIAEYAKPRFPMFQSRNIDPVTDDNYGMSNADLNFPTLVTSAALVPR